MTLRIEFIIPLIATIFAFPHTYFASLPIDSSFLLFSALFILFISGLILISKATPKQIDVFELEK